MNLAKNPDYNLGLSFDLDHKKKHSEADLELKYGADPKNYKKRIVLSTSLDRKALSLKNANLKFKMNAVAPEHVSDLILLIKINIFCPCLINNIQIFKHH